MHKYMWYSMLLQKGAKILCIDVIVCCIEQNGWCKSSYAWKMNGIVQHILAYRKNASDERHSDRR